MQTKDVDLPKHYAVTRSGRDKSRLPRIDAYVQNEGDSPKWEGLPEVADVVGGHYELLGLLGQGMFGRVYLARRIDIRQHEVALKILPRALWNGRDVERELVMLALVSHPNVVELKDHGAEGDYVWFTMPRYRGETLASRLLRGALSLEEAHDIFIQIAEGVAALHAAGLRHQDIKPENIFLANVGSRVFPILLDLGVAAAVSSEFVAGTLAYSSPEQLSALLRAQGGTHDPSLELGPAMDTYCLAATLLEAIVGPTRYPGGSAESLADITLAQETRAMAPIKEDALPGLTGEPRTRLIEAFRRWFHPDPKERSSMRRFITELDVLLEQKRQLERDLLRKKERDSANLNRLRFSTAALLVLSAAATMLLVSKRETLRLASELDHARKVGAASFDKLDSCTASFRVTSNDLASCVSERNRKEKELQKTLSAVSESSASALANLQGLYATRSRELEEAQRTAEACGRQRDEVVALQLAMTKDRDQALREREQLQQKVDQARSQLTSLEGEVSRCRVARDSCLETELARIQEEPRPEQEKTATHAAVPKAEVSPQVDEAPQTPQ